MKPLSICCSARSLVISMITMLVLAVAPAGMFADTAAAAPRAASIARAVEPDPCHDEMRGEMESANTDPTALCDEADACCDTCQMADCITAPVAPGFSLPAVTFLTWNRSDSAAPDRPVHTRPFSISLTIPKRPPRI